MNQYRGKPPRVRKSTVVFVVLLTFVFFYLFYQVHNIKLKIESETPKQTGLVKDPCLELRILDDQNKSLAVKLRQSQSALLSELALQVELAYQRGNKALPVENIVALLKKYDNTETKMYHKLYSGK